MDEREPDVTPPDVKEQVDRLLARLLAQVAPLRASRHKIADSDEVRRRVAALSIQVEGR